MAVHFKFKAAKDYDTISFDGPYISVGDLKRAIVTTKKIRKGAGDFDLEITNAQTGQVFMDESHPVPRNTSVIVKRIPSSKPNALSSLNDPAPPSAPPNHVSGAVLPGISESSVAPTSAPPIVMAGPATDNEEENLNTVLQNSYSEWDQIPRGRLGDGHGRVPPSTYICHRCNQPGHLINHCPTNGDPKYDFTKLKKPTGIPKSFLKVVEGAGGRGAAVMEPNEGDKRNKQDPLKNTDGLVMSVKDGAMIPKELQCTLCKSLFRDVMRTACCGQHYCDECIREELLDNGLICPNCQKQSEVEDLKPAVELMSARAEYMAAVRSMGQADAGANYVPLSQRLGAMPNGPSMARADAAGDNSSNRNSQTANAALDQSDDLEEGETREMPPNHPSSNLHHAHGDGGYHAGGDGAPPFDQGPPTHHAHGQAQGHGMYPPQPAHYGGGGWDPMGGRGGGRGGRGGGRGGGVRKCYICDESGHIARDCPQGPVDVLPHNQRGRGRGRGGRGGRGGFGYGRGGGHPGSYGYGDWEGQQDNGHPNAGGMMRGGEEGDRARRNGGDGDGFREGWRRDRDRGDGGYGREGYPGGNAAYRGGVDSTRERDGGDRGRDIEADRDRPRERDRGDRERERERDRGDRERERERDRGDRGERDRTRDRDRDWDRERDRDRAPDRSRDRYRDHNHNDDRRIGSSYDERPVKRARNDNEGGDDAYHHQQRSGGANYHDDRRR